MAKRSKSSDENFESDRVAGFAHPRETETLLGQGAALELASAALRGGRPPHAWLITGPPGIGKATLAYRMARYLLRYGATDEGPADLSVPRDDAVARQIEARAHPGLLVLKRGLNPRTGKPQTELPVDEVRRLSGFFGMTAGAGGWRVAIVDPADDMNENAANALLKQALALSPDDMYALRTVATINLCDCVNAWSGDPEVQKAVGAAAMEKYLRADPTSPYMLLEKANLYQLRQRWEESLVILDKVLERDPDSHYGLATKAVSLLKLGRAKEAQVIMDGLLLRYPNDWGDQGVSADVAFAQGDYARAAQLAQKATAQMADADLRDSVSGPLRLTLISAEAHLGHIERARAALADLTTMRPDLTTIAAIRKWVHPSADLAGSEELYAGLRLAGLKD